MLFLRAKRYNKINIKVCRFETIRNEKNTFKHVTVSF